MVCVFLSEDMVLKLDGCLDL
jgi:hypothetical protein